MPAEGNCCLERFSGKEPGKRRTPSLGMEEKDFEGGGRKIQEGQGETQPAAERKSTGAAQRAWLGAPPKTGGATLLKWDRWHWLWRNWAGEVLAALENLAARKEMGSASHLLTILRPMTTQRRWKSESERRSR
uniref:Uncharacterized protein n=1 Tax=Sphaerodactylus townsendi TaxID=933632 RepID=A0ACB8ERM1_9SAUR